MRSKRATAARASKLPDAPPPRPGPGRPTSEQAERRDRELLTVALELFSVKGFDGTTIDEITKDCNMAKRTVYARYVDKSALYKAAVRYAVEQWNIPKARLDAVRQPDLHATLMRVADMWVSNVLSPLGFRLSRIVNSSGRTPEIESVNEGFAESLAFLTEVFAAAFPNSQKPAEDAADAAHAFLQIIVAGPVSMVSWGEADTARIKRRALRGAELFLTGALRQ